MQPLLEISNEFYKGSNKFRHEYELSLEAQKLGIEVNEYKRLYRLYSRSPSLMDQVWCWTGFGEKKLWDFLQLLIVPIVLSLGTFYLQEAAKNRENQLAEDRNRQESLNKYFETVINLVFEKQLRTSQAPEVLFTARSKTLTTLRELDGVRKGQLLGFLYDSQLIGSCEFNPRNLSSTNCQVSIIDLRGARLNGLTSEQSLNLRGSNLSRTSMVKANLPGADLSNADMQRSHFREVNLSNSLLVEAQMQNVTMEDVDLSCAFLKRTTLTGSRLKNINFEQADLRGADLSNSTVDESTNFKGAVYDANTKFPTVRMRSTENFVDLDPNSKGMVDFDLEEGTQKGRAPCTSSFDE